MKVAFDEHVPLAMAKAFTALANEGAFRRSSLDIILEKAKDYAPRSSDRDYIKKNDVPWLDRFAAAGGHAVISGDVGMRYKSHERLALYSHEFVTIFFERQWAQWNFFLKSSLLLHWWPEVCAKIKNGEPGTFWVIPAHWPTKDKNLRNVSFGLAQMLKDRPTAVTQKRRRSLPIKAATKPPAKDPRQDSFLTTLEIASDGLEQD